MITKVYTKTGDGGETSIVGGFRISKSDVRLEAYGTVDELNSNMGLLASMLENGHDKELVERIQNNLFNVGTHLAIDQSKTPLYDSGKLNVGEIESLEKEIDAIISILPEQKYFVLPGGCTQAAIAHVCRTVCRRAERRVAALSETATVSPEILQYLNRLSDFLFVFAKKINLMAGMEEKRWDNICK
ncbi:cob(I)yrinic acid a,c-diamide adenosyltransferase [Xylanibacter muris]|nr:cob(I)yrinic acid a,c-diamide adenosyltransferase [Xylanibacter muris]